MRGLCCCCCCCPHSCCCHTLDRVYSTRQGSSAGAQQDHLQAGPGARPCTAQQLVAFASVQVPAAAIIAVRAVCWPPISYRYPYLLPLPYQQPQPQPQLQLQRQLQLSLLRRLFDLHIAAASVTSCERALREQPERGSGAEAFIYPSATNQLLHLQQPRFLLRPPSSAMRSFCALSRCCRPRCYFPSCRGWFATSLVFQAATGSTLCVALPSPMLLAQPRLPATVLIRGAWTVAAGARPQAAALLCS